MTFFLFTYAETGEQVLINVASISCVSSYTTPETGAECTFIEFMDGTTMLVKEPFSEVVSYFSNK
jgi:hypothetical protein